MGYMLLPHLKDVERIIPNGVVCLYAWTYHQLSTLPIKGKVLPHVPIELYYRMDADISGYY